ncbi:MAG: DUF3553 domain-containing protein [Planctomycetota bacterium]
MTPPTETPIFTVGDEVVHPKKPEWGVGAVTKAEKAVHEGKPCQRLSIRFDRAGMKTVSTAFAALRPAREQAATPTEAALDVQGLAMKLAELPREAIDTRRAGIERVAALLQELATDPEDGDMLAWAIRETGLRDPMSLLSRAELESRLRTRRAAAERELARVLGRLSRPERAQAEAIAAAAPSAAQRAWARASRGR